MKAKRFVVLEHLDGPHKGTRFWTLNSDNNTQGMGKVAYKEVFFTNDSSEAIAECNRKTDNNE